MHHGKRVTKISDSAASTRLSRPFEAGSLAVPETGRLLYLEAEPGPVLSLLPRDRTDLVQGHAATANALSAGGYAVAQLAPPTPPYAMTLMQITRHRAAARGLVAMAYAAAAEGAPVILTGAKTDGIDSLLKELRRHLTLDGVEAKAHGKVAWFHRNGPMPEALEAWAAAMSATENADGYTTAPGMFSANGIDPASALLAKALPEKLGPLVADLGAGWGYLANEALSRSERITELHLIEADAASLEAARKNVTDPRASFHWADATRLTQKGIFDTVIMNPPFHSSRASEVSLGQSFIATARQILRPGGRLYMVANRHLAYETTLKAAFRKVTETPGTGAFKLFVAEGPQR